MVLDDYEYNDRKKLKFIYLIPVTTEKEHISNFVNVIS